MVNSTIADLPDSEGGPSSDPLSLEAPKPELQHPELALAGAERKLAEARLQIAELEALLEEIPGMFERKFKQRLQPLLEHQKRLQSDNSELRQQLTLLTPVPGEVRLRFNPEAGSGGNRGINLPQLPSPRAIRRGDRRNPRAA